MDFSKGDRKINSRPTCIFNTKEENSKSNKSIHINNESNVLINNTVNELTEIIVLKDKKTY